MVKPRLDPNTTRCLKELKAMISEIESGEFALLRYADISSGEDGFNREISIRTTLARVPMT